MTNTLKTLKRYAIALLSCFAFVLPASASTAGIDYTDQWWNASESGWGVNFIQQNDVIFATLFVYGADGAPRWYVATMRPSGTTYTGPLAQTTGPYFGATSFNPASVIATVVGTMTVNFASGYSGTLTYSVSGVNVTKSIVRQSFANNNLTGHYLGGLTAQGTGCRPGTPNGPILIHDTLTVTQSGQQLNMVVDFFQTGTGARSQCTFAGTLTTQGRVGNVTNGTWNCQFGGVAGNAGTFTLDMVDATQNGMNARFTGSDQFCTYNGYFGGIKDVL